MTEHLGSRLVVDALAVAVERRLPGEGLLAHSDRGSQYASDHYQHLLAKHGITCSRSRKADGWANAPMESFFASLKTDRTKPTYLHRRCRGPYNRHRDRLSVGPARTGELVPRPARFDRRIRTMSRHQPVAAPPRAGCPCARR